VLGFTENNGVTTVKVESEELKRFWADSMLAHLEVKTGQITLLTASPQKKARKRRRIAQSESPFRLRAGDQSKDNPERETEVVLDVNDDFYNDQANYGKNKPLASCIRDSLALDEPVLPFNLSTGVIRSSEVYNSFRPDHVH
jgi:hypothetical protein